MKRYFVAALFFLPIITFGQQAISLKGAIDTMLFRSFEIRLARNSVEINKANNKFGVAGGLPSFNISVNDNQSSTDVKQKLNSGVEIQKSSANGNTMTSSLTGSILLFNGFKVMATRQRLAHLQKMSELQLNLQIQNSIAALMAKYYDIIRQQEYLKILEVSTDVSQKKLDIISERRKVGLANDADYLQAQIDLNTAQQLYRSQLLVVEQAKTDLLQLMSQNRFYDYSINDSIIVDRSIELGKVTGFLLQNPQYLSAEQQIKINEQAVKEVAALRYPTLRLNTGYNLNRSQSQAGLQLLNQNYGPFAGVNLAVPIYNGNAYKIQKEVAQYNVDNARIQQQSLLNALTADAVKTYHNYTTTFQQIDSQQSSIELAKKLINVVLLRFQVNQATILDVKAAQASFENTGYQLVNLEYAAKISEIELKRLMFQLGN